MNPLLLLGGLNAANNGIKNLSNLGFGIDNSIRNWESLKQQDRHFNQNLDWQKQSQLNQFGMTDYMSKNQIQNRYADMEKAGINPLLAAGGSVGGGAMVTNQQSTRDNGSAKSSYPLKNARINKLIMV